MKKHIFLIVALISGLLIAQAQQYYSNPKFTDNWSLGISAGVTTPLKNHAFFGDMRGVFGFHIQKQLSPVFALGAESTFGINTISWINNYPNIDGNSTSALDKFYVGAYSSVNLFNLLGGYNCKNRLFDIEVQAGAGWGYDNVFSENYFATKAGLNFNFNCSKNFTLSLRPSVSFNMTGTSYSPLNVEQTSVAYSREKATFNFMIGFTYNSGPGFKCVEVRNQSEIDKLNATINTLREELDAQEANLTLNQDKVLAMERELNICKTTKNHRAVPIKANITKQNILYVFYAINSPVITLDQQPNIEMIAKYLKNNIGSKVVIKGYSSAEGDEDFNKKLSVARAESVKTMLIEKYDIDADRITAQGAGVGNMFAENDWNRVSICTIED